MSDAMQVLTVAGALLTLAQVIAKLPGGRKSARPAQPRPAPVAAQPRF